MAILVFSGLTVSEGSSLCNQNYTILGKTSGDYSIIFYDLFVDGDCYYWETYSIFLGPENTYTLKVRVDSCATEWVNGFLGDFPSEPMEILGDSDGVFYITDSVYFTAPEYDSGFFRYYNELLSGTAKNTWEWRKNCKENCFDEPVFFGTDYELKHVNHEGLYKSYGIGQAVYFPESQCLVLVTDQPIKAVGMDSMHGLLIYKLFEFE
jgi:hypothetical protein